MSSLIEQKHPFQIKDVKSINEYLFILKNVLRISSNKGVKQKILGINIPVRWSQKKNDFVVDFGSNKNRDITGINLDNLVFYYDRGSEVFNSINHVLSKIKSCNSSELLFEKYRLKKNENRFFNFIISENKIFLSGLYNRCQTSKRSGLYSNKNKKSVLIDNSMDFLSSVQEILNFIDLQKDLRLNKSHKIIYLEFLEKLENTRVCLKEKTELQKDFFLKNYIYKDLKKTKISISQYENILNKKICINDDMLFWFLIYHITLLFNHELLKSLNESKIEGITLYDSISDELIKVVSKFNIKNIDKEIALKEPLMPVSF